MNDDKDNGGIETIKARTPFFSFEIGGKHLRLGDLLTVFILLAIGGDVMLTYAHKENSEKSDNALIGTFKESMKDLHEEQKKTTRAQSLNTCILSQPENKRAEEFKDPNSFCRRMTE